MSANRSYGLMNPNLNVLVQVIINMSGESYNGECLQLSIKHSGSLGLHFSQLCWGSCQNIWNCKFRKVQLYFDSPCCTIWDVSDS